MYHFVIIILPLQSLYCFKLLLCQYSTHTDCNTLGDMDECHSYIETHLLPCITQFALAADKESRWKPLNRHILLKTRDTNPQVR